jgi:hypothetical protein
MSLHSIYTSYVCANSVLVFIYDFLSTQAFFWLDSKKSKSDSDSDYHNILPTFLIQFQLFSSLSRFCIYVCMHMYVCMHIHMRMYQLSRSFISRCSLSLSLYVSMHVCVYAHTRMYLSKLHSSFGYACMYTSIYASMYACMHACVEYTRMYNIWPEDIWHLTKLKYEHTFSSNLLSGLIGMLAHTQNFDSYARTRARAHTHTHTHTHITHLFEHFVMQTHKHTVTGITKFRRREIPVCICICMYDCIPGLARAGETYLYGMYVCMSSPRRKRYLYGMYVYMSSGGEEGICMYVCMYVHAHHA